MIIPPREWLRSAGEQRLVLRPPAGGGRIVYHERLPLVSFVEAVADVTAREPRFRPSARLAPARMVTEEGELGAWGELAGHLDGVPMCWFFGGVCLDEFTTLIEGRADRRAAEELIGATTRRLILGAAYGLGLRRRRFVYAPPPGWSGVPNGLVTTWYPAEFPAHRSRIVVQPATPSTATAADELEAIVHDEMAAGLDVSGPILTTPIAARGALAGLRCSLAADDRADPARRRIELAVMTDGRHRYLMWLEEAGVAPAAGVALFNELVASVEPLPLPGGRDGATNVGSLLSPWID